MEVSFFTGYVYTCMFGVPLSLLVKSVVRGYHIFQVLWEPKVREKFIVLHELIEAVSGHLTTASWVMQSIDRLEPP